MTLLSSFKQLNELQSEDLSSETNEQVFFNARQINENVKLDETQLIKADKALNDTKKVF